jgi:hypothetical protein
MLHEWQMPFCLFSRHSVGVIYQFEDDRTHHDMRFNPRVISGQEVGVEDFCLLKKARKELLLVSMLVRSDAAGPTQINTSVEGRDACSILEIAEWLMKNVIGFD